jgi:hypothetical protein
MRCDSNITNYSLIQQIVCPHTAQFFELYSNSGMTRYLLGLMLVLTLGLMACERAPVDEVITPEGSVLEVPATPDGSIIEEVPVTPAPPVLEEPVQPQETPLQEEEGLPPAGNNEALTPATPSTAPGETPLDEELGLPLDNARQGAGNQGNELTEPLEPLVPDTTPLPGTPATPPTAP